MSGDKVVFQDSYLLRVKKIQGTSTKQDLGTYKFFFQYFNEQLNLADGLQLLTDSKKYLAQLNFVSLCCFFRKTSKKTRNKPHFYTKLI